MFRSFAVPALALSLALVACSPDEDHHSHAGGSGGGKVGPNCALYTTCGSCTPVVGCGWCAYENGKGRCAPGPASCGDVRPFRWNWDPNTCPASPPSDGGVSDGGTDGASEASSEDAGPDDAAPDDAPAPTCAVPEAATAGSCAPTTGGTLCKEGEYTLGCHGDAPAPSLGCASALSTEGGTYHCCPCAPAP